MNISSLSGGIPDASAIAEMRQKMFAKIDGNNDGGIDKSELKSFGSKIGLDDSQIDQAFGDFDTDGSGAIDAKEHEAIFDKIGEQLKSSLGQLGGSKLASSSGSKDSNDVLIEMLDKIREHSQTQQAGGNLLEQFLSQLQGQPHSYGQSGSSEPSSIPSYFSAVA